MQTAHLKVVDVKGVRSVITGMESTVCDAFHLANVMALALTGADGVAMEEKDKRDALQTLAYSLCDATKKCRDEWEELNDLK